MVLEWWWWTITFSYSSIYKSVQQHINNRDSNWKKQRAQVDISKAQVSKKEKHKRRRKSTTQIEFHQVTWITYSEKNETMAVVRLPFTSATGPPYAK